MAKKVLILAAQFSQFGWAFKEVSRQILNLWPVEAGLQPERLDEGGWTATFHALAGCAFLRVRDPAAENVAAARAMLDRLSPALCATQRTDPPDVQSNPGMNRGHHPEMAGMNTTLEVAGAGIRAGTAARCFRLTQLAPLVAALF